MNTTVADKDREIRALKKDLVWALDQLRLMDWAQDTDRANKLRKKYGCEDFYPKQRRKERD